MNPGLEDYPTPNCMYCKMPTLEPWEYGKESESACPRCSRATVEGIAKVLFMYRIADEDEQDDAAIAWDNANDETKELWRGDARAVLAYLDGKEDG